MKVRGGDFSHLEKLTAWHQLHEQVDLRGVAHGSDEFDHKRAVQQAHRFDLRLDGLLRPSLHDGLFVQALHREALARGHVLHQLHASVLARADGPVHLRRRRPTTNVRVGRCGYPGRGVSVGMYSELLEADIGIAQIIGRLRSKPCGGSERSSAREQRPLLQRALLQRVQVRGAYGLHLGQVSLVAAEASPRAHLRRPPPRRPRPRRSRVSAGCRAGRSAFASADGALSLTTSCPPIAPSPRDSPIGPPARRRHQNAATARRLPQ